MSPGYIKKGRKPTPKQARAIKELTENVGISVGEAKRRAGYSASEVAQPQRLTNSQAYNELLEQQGMTREMLAKGHQRNVQATTIKERIFTDLVTEELIPIPKESTEYKKDGRENQFREITVHTPISDKEIKAFFEKIPDAKLLRIERGYHHKTAVYLIPNYAAQSKFYELGYKVKGLMAPEKHEVEFTDAADDQKKLVDDLINKNDSTKA